MASLKRSCSQLQSKDVLWRHLDSMYLGRHKRIGHRCCVHTLETLHLSLFELLDCYGSEQTAALCDMPAAADVYQQALPASSLGCLYKLPTKAVRLAVVVAPLQHALAACNNVERDLVCSYFSRPVVVQLH